MHRLFLEIEGRKSAKNFAAFFAHVLRGPASAVSGPSGPKPKESKTSQKRVSRGSGQRDPKSPKGVRKESKTPLFDSFLTLFGLFLDFWGFGVSGPKGPKRLAGPFSTHVDENFRQNFALKAFFRRRHMRNMWINLRL